MPTLVQLNVSRGGMPKHPILAAHVAADGVTGDWQKNRKYHGGPDRAVCLFSVEVYDWLRTQDIDLAWGSVGENFTTRGVDYAKLGRRDRLKVGGCVIEITDVRIPCRNLARWDPRLPKLIVGRSGWVAKVVEEGAVKPGDAVEVLPPE